MALISRLLLAVTLGSSLTLAQNYDADNDKDVTDARGLTYKISCNTKIETPLITPRVKSLASCVYQCGTDARCKSVDFNPANRDCSFYASETPATRPQPGIHSSRRTTPLEKPKEAEKPPPPPQQSQSQPQAPPPSEEQKPIAEPAPEGGSPPQGSSDVVIAKDLQCKGDDRTYYQIQCGYQAEGQEVGRHQKVGSFAECMNLCSTINGCISAQYMGSPPSPGFKELECVLSDGEGPGSRTCQHWFAYTIPPPPSPEVQEEPFPHTLCETVCPFSDGLTFESDHGESFRISCSKRHGMKIPWTQSAETFDDCINMCAKIVPCHSVDYQARTNKCYMGTPHDGPNVSAASFQSATSIGCSGACKKSSCACGKGGSGDDAE